MLIVFVLLSSLMEQCLGWLSPMLPSDRHSSRLRVSFFEPGNKFGNKNYWDKTYRDGNEGLCEDEFSWYCGWNEELEPFFIELVGTSAKVLIPGIGNDGCIRDMFDAGYTHLTYQLRKLAFDYAAEGVECAKRLLGSSRVDLMDGLHVADARSLPYEDETYDAVLDKGTLDSVYLSGGSDKELAQIHLGMAVKELARVLKRGGIVFCVTAACVDAVQSSFDSCNEKQSCWKQIRDGSIYITDDGYTSNNVDATMLVWERV